jgi:Undecaprenyl-phosphate galactose phosphotransferase WbaP
MVLGQEPALYLDLLPLFAVFPVLYAAADLYPGFGLGAVETLRRLSYATATGFVLLAAATFTLKLHQGHSRIAFLLALGIALIIVPLVRFAVLSVAGRQPWWGEPTVIIGDPQHVERIVRFVADGRSLGYRIVGALCPRIRTLSDSIAGVPLLPALDNVVSRLNITTAIVWNDGGDASLVAALQRVLRHVIVVSTHSGLPVEHVRIRNLGATIGIEFTNELLRPRNRALKRAVDVLGGTILLVAAAPLIALGALAVKLASPGAAFFRQERDGSGDRRITLWKLRTMYSDADARLAECLARDPGLRREWEEKLKLARDPRVIPYVGSFLRRFSIDELPQLVSVVRGEMSLVGPRPFPEYHLRKFTPEFRRLRASVRPGLTGMWQVMVRSNGRLEDQMQYDSYYIRNWSLWLDIYLLARTAIAVLTGRGAA